MKVKINRNLLKEAFFYKLTKEELERNFDKLLVNVSFDDVTNLYQSNDSKSLNESLGRA